jgi:hypothetical protein
MRIVYCCFAGTHSSVIAATVHLGRLPERRIPTMREIIAIKEFDRRDRDDWGTPRLLGADEPGNEIYILGLGPDQDICLQAVYHLLVESAPDPGQWKFFKTLRQINWLTRVGGFCSRRLHLVKIGRFLAARGIQSDYFDLVKLVRQVKEWNLICQNGKWS